MKQSLECECGFEAIADGVDDLIRSCQIHAKEVHGMTLGAEQLLAQARDGQREEMGMNTAEAIKGWENLSPSEARVLALVAEGLSNDGIAAQLVLSRRTVETHVYHLFQKLQVSSRLQLGVLAIRKLASPVFD